MNEKVKIFFLFLLCWSLLRAIYFVVLSLLDIKSVGNIKEFFVFCGGLLLGVLMYPISALIQEWWFFGILTILYFLFGGGIKIFITLVVIGLIVCYLPSDLGFSILAIGNSKNKQD